MIARQISEAALLATPAGLLGAIVVGLVSGGSAPAMLAGGIIAGAIAVAFRVEASR